MTTITEDPIVMYLVVRESLNMSTGKISAQVGHAVQNLLINYFKIQIFASKKNLDILPEESLLKAKITTDWLGHASRKVVLKADDKEWLKLKEHFKDVIIIKDAGFTEVAPGSETVMCLWPMLKSTAPKEIKRLQVLK